MIVFAAVDDENGLMFNNRRQSRDKALRQYILNAVSAAGSVLWMNSYTAKLFSGLTPSEEALLRVDEDFMSRASRGEYCYVENVPAKPYEGRLEKIILCFWNRRYPADTFWDIDMGGWLPEKSEDIAGSSHEKITVVSYRRQLSDFQIQIFIEQKRCYYSGYDI